MRVLWALNENKPAQRSWRHDMNGQIQEKVFGQSPKVIFFIDH